MACKINQRLTHLTWPVSMEAHVKENRMKKMNDPGGPVMKPLAELTLLDRFLFACVMEDRRTMELCRRE